MKSKVVLINCNSYDEELLVEKLKKGFELLGGLDKLVKKDEKILLKLNLVRGAEPQRAVTTHPDIAVALARILNEAGYQKVSAGDSCGFGSTAKIMKELSLDTKFKKYNVALADFDEGIRIENEQGIHAKKFVLAKEVVETDALISVSKMKTHALEYITGAVKNQYGCIQGLNKAKGHTVYTSQESFAKMLIDLNLTVKPRFYIMDGITAMEGNGPTSGTPVQMNVILMSRDPVAIDSVFSRLINLDPGNVPTNVFGEKMGLGKYKKEDIELVTDTGETDFDFIISKYMKPDFDVIRSRHTSRGLMKLVTGLSVFKRRPRIKAELCKKCGVCVEACPVDGKAISFKNGRSKPPVYNYRKCIKCFCCQEMCPHKAIEVKGRI